MPRDNALLIQVLLFNIFESLSEILLEKFQSISNFPITYGYNTARKMGLLTGGFQKFYLEEIEVYHVLYSSSFLF